MTRLYDWVVGCFGFGSAPRLRDQNACEKLYFWAYLWPRLKDSIRPLPQHEILRESRSSSEDPFEMISTLSLVALGNNVNHELRSRATRKFIDEMRHLSDELESEIQKQEFQKRTTPARN